MEAGPFKIDSDYESLLKSAEWKMPADPFRVGSAR